MKWITPLWSNPIGWSEKIAKTELRVLICWMFHIIFVCLVLRKNYELDQTIAILPLIVIFGLVFPCMYIYAIYRLLKVIREKESSHSD